MQSRAAAASTIPFGAKHEYNARALKFNRALLASQLEGEQSAASKLSGTTGGSTESGVTLSFSGEDSISTTGKASTTTSGSGTTEASSKTSGYVRKGNADDKEDAPYVANSSVGITAAQGGEVETNTEAWGSSAEGPDGPTANAGHNVAADGPYTASTGDQAVALLSERP
ncbi:hypothetical protein KSW81_000728 [Nannochloris sp. 'desiccata']|nr:hypothetical protein KSW81_000728 [Chlorella desiccata (nom. nud.)]